MEVTCQLRLNQINKSGLAQIQITCCWDMQRIRFGSGQKCLPSHWDARRQRVKDKADSYATDINQVLDDYESAAQATYRAAQGQPLDKAQLRAGIEQHRAALIAERTGLVAPPVVQAPVLTFLDHFDAWIAEESQKISVRTGRKLT
ncbi:MAG: hypothetical protein EOO60_02380, partial [Hymenobacter sp.]